MQIKKRLRPIMFVGTGSDVGKSFISTPSYSQVVQPVSAKAVDRWKNYERHFQGCLPSLVPLLQRWGYPA